MIFDDSLFQGAVELLLVVSFPVVTFWFEQPENRMSNSVYVCLVSKSFEHMRLHLHFRIVDV